MVRSDLPNPNKFDDCSLDRETFFNPLVNIPAVHNREDQNFIFDDPKHDAIVSDTQFLVTLQGPSKRFAISLRLDRKTAFDRALNSLGDIAIERRNILGVDLGMIN